jgi:fumarate reductase flavoprotein subunit
MTERGPSLTKRQFIAQATAVVGFAGRDALFQEARAADTYDMIIIGGGTAGIPCAICAADKGAKVLLIEKSSQIGGTLWLAGGSMAAAGTRVQAQKGIKDTPDMHFANIMELSHNKAIPEIVRRFVDNAAPMADWLGDLGFVVRDGEPVAGRGGHTSFAVPRYFQGRERGRSVLKTLLPVLAQHVASGQVKVLLSTSVAELVLGPDRGVQGIIARTDNGPRTQFSARKVVITSGGYCSGPEMYKKVTGRTLYSASAYFMSKGEGLLLGEGAGGFIRGGEYQALGGTVLNDRNYPSVSIGQAGGNPARRPPWEINVNKLGLRYIREDEPDIDARDSIFPKQPEARGWVIFDQDIKDKAPPLMGNKSKAEMDVLFAAHPMFTKAQSLDALAQRTGIDGTSLKRTVEDYNAGVRSKKDRFGREFLPAEIAKPPFYAVELHGGNIVGFGGLAVNADMQVLRPDGSVIRNLYAAGEVIGLAATCGDSVIGGHGVTPSLTFGRLIGLGAMTRA